jgi:succinate dehydrogenase / fumarate reductase cytochrome b subunit
MIPLREALRSSVGKKFLMAFTGLAFAGFLVTHLAANFLLMLKDGSPYNNYAETLASYGALLYVAEVGLFILFVAHAVNGILLKLNHKSARGRGYERYQSKGTPSRQNLSTRSMIISGVVLLVFLVIHVSHFKFGPGMAEGYVASVKGKEIRDLHRLVVETFKKPEWAFPYVAVMLMLGMHLRHGLWSGLQSLGATNSRTSGPLYFGLSILGFLMGVGFLLIPLWIYFDPMGIY